MPGNAGPFAGQHELRRSGGGPAASVFTGDTLFVGDVGRPDLRDTEEEPTELAGALYDSLFGKLLALPDDSKVFPAHGCGSLCGRKISSAPFTTIGQERLVNWALQIKDRDTFVRTMVGNLPERPAYFPHDVQVNLAGAPPLSSLPQPGPLTEAEMKLAAAGGAIVIDTRSAPFFGAGHFPGSLSLGLGSSLFSTWTGFFVPFGRPIALVVGSAEGAQRARLELARIGYDNVIGYLEADLLTHTRQLSQLGVDELHIALKRGQAPRLLDVRTAGEFEARHIEGALHLSLPSLPRRLAELPREDPLAVICGSGYRSPSPPAFCATPGSAASRMSWAGWGLTSKPSFRNGSRPSWFTSARIFDQFGIDALESALQIPSWSAAIETLFRQPKLSGLWHCD